MFAGLKPLLFGGLVADGLYVAGLAAKVTLTEPVDFTQLLLLYKVGKVKVALSVGSGMFTTGTKREFVPRVVVAPWPGSSAPRNAVIGFCGQSWPNKGSEESVNWQGAKVPLAQESLPSSRPGPVPCAQPPAIEGLSWER